MRATLGSAALSAAVLLAACQEPLAPPTSSPSTPEFAAHQITTSLGPAERTR
jgi:hypothetical protein